MYLRLYREPALYVAARIIGYEGIGMSVFSDAAKHTGIDVNLLRNPVYDLTRYDKCALT